MSEAAESSEATGGTAPEEFKGRLAPGKDWTEIVAWVGDLPPLPQVASQAIALVENPDTSAAQLTKLLGQDTALAARVLKIANSAMFSVQREITTLSQAIMIIGFKALKGIIVAATLRQLNRKFGKIEKMIWENSTCTAVCAHTITMKLKKSYIDEAFLLGLLHDLGKLVLVRQLPEEYSEIVKGTTNGKTFYNIEQDSLGFAHPLIGALVAKKWNFNPETCQVILHHHDEVVTPFDNLVDEKTAIIQFADLLAHKLGYGHQPGYPEQEEELLEAGKKLGFEGEDVLEKLVEECGEAFDKQAAAFG